MVGQTGRKWREVRTGRTTVWPLTHMRLLPGDGWPARTCKRRSCQSKSESLGLKMQITMQMAFRIVSEGNSHEPNRRIRDGGKSRILVRTVASYQLA